MSGKFAHSAPKRTSLLAGHMARTIHVAALAAVAPALVLIFLFAVDSSQIAADQFARDSMNVAQAVSVLHRQFTDKTHQLLITLNVLLAQAPPGDHQAQERILRDFQATNPSYSSFIITDRNGILAAAAHSLPPGVSVTDRRYWQEGVRTMRFTAGEFSVGRISGEPSLHFSLPRQDANGQFDGMLLAAARLNFPEQYLERLQLPPNSAFLLLDNKGVRLYRYPSSPQFAVGVPIPQGGLDVLKTGAHSGYFQDTDDNGTPTLCSFLRLTLDDEQPPYGTLMLVIPLEAAKAQGRATLLRNLLFLAGAALAALLLAHFMGRHTLVKPVRRMVDAARRLGDGVLDAKVSDGSLGGELGQLAASFDDMAARLKTREAERASALAELAERGQTLRTLFNHTREYFGLLRPDGTVLEISPSALDAVGSSLCSVQGTPLWDTPWWNDDPKKQLRLKQAVAEAQEGEKIRFMTTHTGANGRVIQVDFSLQAVRDDMGKPLLLIAEGRDVTERHEMESRLSHMALHDPLTGLANRTLLRDRISQAMAWAKRYPAEGYAVLFIDLDRFGVINDSLGHSVGDRILKEIANRFQDALREGDTLARYGSDEFVVVVRPVSTAREALKLSRRLMACLSAPISTGTASVQINASIGIELRPGPGATADEIIRNANLAMHTAKHSRQKKAKVFTSRLLEDLETARFIEQELPAALKNSQLTLVFQPIVHADRGEIPAGFEALLRWHHPKRGPIPPMEFIRMAEDTGLIDKLGEWVLHKACATLMQWTGDHPAARNVFVSVNVSPYQIENPGFAAMVRSVMTRHGVHPTQLHLEITETAIMDTSRETVERLRELADLGVRLLVDDFGAGYSNLALMTRLPVSDLKIDLSIVTAMIASEANKAVVRAIVTMAAALGLRVVAEGVETLQQRDALLELGCALQQGFLHAKPLPAAEALRFCIDKHRVFEAS